MSEPAFVRASAVERLADGRFRAEIPDGWQQGRGAFGGLVLGTMLRAVERSEEDPKRRTRTLMGDLCGPVLPGEVHIDVRALRRGNNQSNWRAELVQNGETLAVVSVVTSAPRHASPPVATSSPQRVPFDDVRALPMPPGIAPTFAQHFEYRPHGALPFCGGAEAVVTGWVRERDPLAVTDAPAMIARLDAYYPALFSTLTAPRPCATIAFAAELLVDPRTLDAATPLYYVARDAAIRDGFFVELRELWHGDELVAMNQQTFVVLK